MKRLSLLKAVAVMVAALALPATGGGLAAAETAAVVNGQVITKEALVQRLLERQGAAALTSMIDEALVDQAAIKAGVTASEAEIDSRIKDMQSGKDAAAFQAELAGRGLTPATLRGRLAYDIVVMKLLGPRVKVTDEEVKAGYEANKAYMHQAEMVQARLIVVGSEAEAKDLKKRLEQGEKFEDLAMKYSLDPESKQNGGAMGLVPKGSGLLSEQQERVLFALAQGQVSVPVEAKGQWVLFRVDAKVPAKDPTYEEVKDYLRQRMIERKFREELPKWMLELRKAAQVERKITF